MNYYNEHEPKTAAWLRELIKDGLIPNGEVDERDIQQVTGKDLAGFTQVHLFAGIGGWSEALRLAGWPSTRPVWTGSCPCQDFSSAGKREGHGGSRNLWPEMFRLIKECRPAVIFGEQVDAAIRYGWLDGVFTDLETEDYACGAAVLPAACVRSPHGRHRIWWLADFQFSERRPELETSGKRRRRSGLGRSGDAVGLADSLPRGQRTDGQPQALLDAEQRGENCGVFQEHATGNGRTLGTGQACAQSEGRASRQAEQRLGASGSLPLSECDGRRPDKSGRGEEGRTSSWRSGESVRLGEPRRTRPQGLAGHGDGSHEPGRIEAHSIGPVAENGNAGLLPDATSSEFRRLPSAWNEQPDRTNNFILCRDNKIRRVPSELSLFPLVDGIQPARVACLRGAGNAIVPEAAAEFIRAYEEIKRETTKG